MTTTQSPRIATITGMERRTFQTELTARDIGGLEGVLQGYASITESGYDMGSYQETMKRGAFAKTLSENPDCQLLINHEGTPLARTTNNSLTLREDDRGLFFSATLDKGDPTAAMLLRKIGSGLMDQCSFAFRTVSQEWNSDRTKREIQEVSLDRGDVSVVNYGANPHTNISARSRSRGKGTLSLYQARARALALKGHVPTRGRPTLDYYQAMARASALRGRR